MQGGFFSVDLLQSFEGTRYTHIHIFISYAKCQPSECVRQINVNVLTLERFRAGHFTCKNTDWEKWREPIRKVEPETTDWALHTRIPVRIEPSHFLTAAECWSIAESDDTQSGKFYFSVSYFFCFFPFVLGRWPDLGVLPRLHTCFQFIYLFSSPAMPPSSSSSSSSLSRASSWKDSSPPSRLFASK